MEEDGEWVMVGKPTDRDIWSPSKMVNVETEEASKSLKVRSFEAAKHWTDAFPIGNGRLGAMIWGGVASETINLNGITFQISHRCFATTYFVICVLKLQVLFVKLNWLILYSKNA